MYPPAGRHEIDSRSALVAERPGYDAWVVLVPFEHPFSPVQEGSLPFRPVCQASVRFITHPVALNVGFVDHIEAVLVAEFVPPWIIGVVGRPYCVDVVLLHQPDVFQHRFFRYALAVVWVMFMSVDSLDVHCLAVDE